MRAARPGPLAALAVAALAVVLSGCGTGAPAPTPTSPAASPSPAAASTSPPSASPSPAQSPTAPGSGIAGTVAAGPTCPVEQVGKACPPAPVTATVEARIGARIVGSARTSATGTYRMAVPPGSYSVVVVGSGPFPRCPDTPATVSPGAVTTVNIRCDTGIR